MKVLTTNHILINQKQNSMNTKQLLTTAFLATLLTGMATAQSVTYSTATETGLTKDFSEITEPTTARSSLTAATSIALTGTWTTTNIQALQNALKESGTLRNVVNSTLASADLSGMSFPSADTEVSFLDLFRNCQALETVNLPSSDVTNKVDIHCAFELCKALKQIDLSKFKSITNMSWIFNEDNSLTSVTMPTADNNNNVSFNGAFSSCSALASEIDLTGFKNITNLERAFDTCDVLTTVKMPTAKNTNAVSCKQTFRNCRKLSSPVDLSGFENITSLRSTFLSCNELTGVTMPTATNNNGMELNYAFSTCRKLSSPIDLSGFKNGSGKYNSKTMVGTFENCDELPYVKLSYVDSNTDGNTTFGNSNPNMIKYVIIDASNENWNRWNGQNNLIVNGKVQTNVVLADNAEAQFIIPEAFDLNGKTITYTRNFSDKPSGIDGKAAGWETICLPFTPTTIAGTNKESGAVTLSPFNAEGGYEGSAEGVVVPFWLRSLGADGYAPATSITPNTPYIIAMPNNEKYAAKYNVTGDVTFSATGTGTDIVKVTASPETAAATAYTLNANYDVVPQAESIYVIDAATGTAFVANSADATPFHPYATANGSPAQAPARFVIGGEGGGATAIEEAILMGRTPGSQAAEGIRVYAAGGVLTIEAPQACTVQVYSVDGQLVRTVQVNEGTNEVIGLAHGVYVVGGVKIVM